MAEKRHHENQEKTNTVFHKQIILYGIDSLSKEEISSCISLISKNHNLPFPEKIVHRPASVLLIFKTVYSSSIFLNHLFDSNDFSIPLTCSYGEFYHQPREKIDWTCPSCDALNFARRAKCFKCSKIKSSGLKEDIKATVMVRGILQLTEEEIWESFEKIAKVKDVRRIKDRFTGDYKDFAFVEFENESEADFVIEFSLTSAIRICGRPVSVCKSKKRKQDNTGEELETCQAYENVPKDSLNLPKGEIADKDNHEVNFVNKYAEKAGTPKKIQKLNSEQQKRNTELENYWIEKLKSNIAICFKCEKWFPSVELGRLHEISHR